MFWSFAGAVISRGLTLCASVLCARFLGKAGFGELGMIQSTVGTCGIFAGLGLGLTATKYVAAFRDKDPSKVGRILALSAVAAFFSSATMAVLLLATARLLARDVLSTPPLAGALAIGAGLVFFGGLNGAQTGALAGFEAFRTISKVNALAGLASLPMVLLGVWRWGLNGAVAGLVASMALNWLLNNRALRQECLRSGIQYDFRSCRQELRVFYEFSLPAFLASIVVGPALWICNAILAHQPDGYSQLGLYTAADRWRLLILFVPASIFGLVVPVLSNLYGAGDRAGFRRVLRINMLLNSGLVLLLGIVIAGLAHPIMSLFGESFRAGWLVLVILSFSAVPEALNTVLGHPLIVSDAMWWRFGFDVLLAALLIASAAILIPRWGAMGFACSYAFAFSVVSAGLYLFGSKVAGINRNAAPASNASLPLPVEMNGTPNT